VVKPGGNPPVGVADQLHRSRNQHNANDRGVDEDGGSKPEAEHLGHRVIALKLRPDVCLFDIRMPHVDGVEATRRLAGPDVVDPLAVVVMTTFDTDEYVLGARNRVEIAMWAYETNRVR